MNELFPPAGREKAAQKGDPPSLPETDDDNLILWMLSLTPIQRLEAAQGFVNSIRALQDAGSASSAPRKKQIGKRTGPPCLSFAGLSS